jgi:hypothetical protein
MNACLIEFLDDGHKVVTSRNALGKPVAASKPVVTPS